MTYIDKLRHIVNLIIISVLRFRTFKEKHANRALLDRDVNFMLLYIGLCRDAGARVGHRGALESCSSTSDTNTDTNNMSRACSLLARSTRTSVLEVTTTEVGLVLEVGGIVR